MDLFREKNFSMNECRKIKKLHHTDQHYCLETHRPTNTPATLTASVFGLVRRVQANATTANSSLSSFPFDSCARANQHEVCFELLWSIAGSLPIHYNSIKVNAIFLPNQWVEMHLFHFLLNKCLDKPKLVTICNFNHLLFNYFLGLVSYNDLCAYSL